MEDNIKYYTPKLSELFVGYEYEILEGKEWRKETLEAYMLSTPSIGEACESEMTEILRALHRGELRTPFLTKEQLLKEGWEQGRRDTSYKRCDYNLHYFEDDQTLYIDQWIEYNQEHLDINKKMGLPAPIEKFFTVPKFRGYCKSINELRKIIEYLDLYFEEDIIK